MNWRRFALLILMSMTFGWVMATPALAKKNEKYASLVMDADTGVILSSRYADSLRHPASLAKMMTLLLVFDALDRGDIRLKDRIYISKKAAAAQPSKLGLRAGSSIRVEDAILVLVTKSANDIAIATAEFLGGTESKFALQMTRRAQDIGMSRTVFRNASGLPDAKQVTTARDMAKLAVFILNRYPHYYGYFSTRTFTYQGKTYRNHNRLMSAYSGMDGFKTGYINASGFNLVASARRDGRRLIGIVFGGRTTATRNAHMAEILDAGFQKIKRGARGPQIASAAILNPPIPVRKPGFLVAQDIMKPVQTAASQASTLTPEQARVLATPADEDNVVRQLTRIRPALQSGLFDELTGQGDFDPAVTRRLETGMLAMAVHKSSLNPRPARASFSSGTKTDKNWAVQIGAYNSRVATDDALRRAAQSLPAALKQARPLVVPLRTGKELLFRARLSGFDQAEAVSACRYLRDCITIPPRAD